MTRMNGLELENGWMEQGTRALRAAACMAVAALFLAACGSKESSDLVSTAPASPMADAGAGFGQGAGAIPGSTEDFLVSVQDRIFFSTDSYTLDRAAQQVLGAQAQWLQRYPTTTVVIQGHADERGTREYNLALGSRRASAVKDYLLGLGIAPTRIRTISFGKERPEAPGSDERAWRLNRRSVTAVGQQPGS